MANTEYEIIRHDHHYHLFLVNLLYRTPHFHKDYEINLILDGKPEIVCPNESHQLCSGDIFIVNPFRIHEILSHTPCLILSLQISAALFAAYFPQIDSIEFDSLLLEKGQIHDDVRKLLITLAKTYYGQPTHGTIMANIYINQIFLLFLEHHPYHILNARELSVSRAKGARMRGIMQYIDEHFQEKLLLSDIAEREGLNLYYLSHFFKDTFGISFQNYLTKIRCEHARQLLLLSDYSLLDISIACGFSDPKYFNRRFLEQYGVSPKEYRKNFAVAQLKQQQQSLLTTQEFLSDRAALVTLGQYE